VPAAGAGVPAGRLRGAGRVVVVAAFPLDSDPAGVDRTVAVVKAAAAARRAPTILGTPEVSHGSLSERRSQPAGNGGHRHGPALDEVRATSGDRRPVPPDWAPTSRNGWAERAAASSCW